MPINQKYARVEWERRFLVERFPQDAVITRVRQIRDRYIEGTTLRLRQQTDDGGETVFKLTQKLPAKREGARQGFITSMYITGAEFSVLASLPARMLTKTRYSVPPFGIDVFEGALDGLVLAEAEFDFAGETAALVLPSFIGAEVTDDLRFTGGQLVTASRAQLEEWLGQHGIRLNSQGGRAELRPDARKRL